MSVFQFDPPQNINDLAAAMRRTDLGGPLRHLDLPRIPLRPDQVHALTPQAIDQRIHDLAPVATRLTRLVLTPEQRQKYGKIAAAPLATQLSFWSNASERAAASGFKVPGLQPAARFTSQRDTLNQYHTMARASAMGVTQMLDLRLILGGLMWFMVRYVTGRVVAKLEDPRTPIDKARALKDAFAPLLLYKDQILRAADDQRTLLQQDQERLAAELKQAEQTTLVTDVMHSIRMGYPLDPQQLMQAAIIYQQQQQAASAAATAAAAAVPTATAPAGRRPIVR